MSKINTGSRNRNDAIQFLQFAYNQCIDSNCKESPKTEKKPYGILCNDWYIRFNQWPMTNLYWRRWRRFRHYKSEAARDRALVMLTEHYRKIDRRIQFKPDNTKLVNTKNGKKAPWYKRIFRK